MAFDQFNDINQDEVEKQLKEFSEGFVIKNVTGDLPPLKNNLVTGNNNAPCIPLPPDESLPEQPQEEQLWEEIERLKGLIKKAWWVHSYGSSDNKTNTSQYDAAWQQFRTTHNI